ncbi:MAG: hypothetical protein EZS28_017208 [Streblomastix strix]|uniref:Uncharacterized protein n=1 Tax=Streblomastix strix TaxID=222440 RepID=A0A5J4VXB3_9EUKA|nr:MAG: hypothetical protein EZS28_017208 [Streblomastix strix]
MSTEAGCAASVRGNAHSDLSIQSLHAGHITGDGYIFSRLPCSVVFISTRIMLTLQIVSYMHINVHKLNFRVADQSHFTIYVCVPCCRLSCCNNLVSRYAKTWSKASIACTGGLFCFGGFLRVTKSVAALACCQASTTCSSDGSSAQKSICDASCPDSPAKSTRVAVIEFGGTSSGAAIVQIGTSGSISKFRRNAFTNVGCGCSATYSGFCGTKFAQFGVQFQNGPPVVNIV